MAVVRDAKVEIEIQDVYLADPNIPSHRGRLNSDDWNRYIYLALDLGLMHKGNYSLIIIIIINLRIVLPENGYCIRRYYLSICGFPAKTGYAGEHFLSRVG